MSFEIRPAPYGLRKEAFGIERTRRREEKRKEGKNERKGLSEGGRGREKRSNDDDGVMKTTTKGKGTLQLAFHRATHGQVKRK